MPGFIGVSIGIWAPATPTPDPDPDPTPEGYYTARRETYYWKVYTDGSLSAWWPSFEGDTGATDDGIDGSVYSGQWIWWFKDDATGDYNDTWPSGTFQKNSPFSLGPPAGNPPGPQDWTTPTVYRSSVYFDHVPTTHDEVADTPPP